MHAYTRSTHTHSPHSTAIYDICKIVTLTRTHVHNIRPSMCIISITSPNFFLHPHTRVSELFPNLCRTNPYTYNSLGIRVSQNISFGWWKRKAKISYLLTVTPNRLSRLYLNTIFLSILPFFSQFVSVAKCVEIHWNRCFQSVFRENPNENSIW